MLHPFGSNGPYFQRPCQRDRFPSLMDEIGKLADPLVRQFAIPEFQEMGARWKRGRESHCTDEIRAAYTAKVVDNVKPASVYANAYPLVLRRAMDPYMPRCETPDAPLYTRWPRGHRPKNHPPAARQEGEPAYTGGCYHCLTTGSSDADSDQMAREIVHDILSDVERFRDHMREHLAQIRRDNALL